MKNNSYRPHFAATGSSSTRLASSSAAPASSSIAPTSIGAPAIAAQMLVYVATSLDLSWFLGLFGSAEKKAHISDHINKADESNSSRGYILLTIVIALVLLKFYWTGENREINSNIALYKFWCN
ncbi:hypothetical protein KIW84_064181 [Lathyrus oleraceus]|uniref:Uncharacterized protein n=1 Tax=Pisum sativum TaxID=3888 RepID=A0A9D4WBW6_PEA|nr:hypothetical protein KIW84_064181 [Pisum sativum]